MGITGIRIGNGDSAYRCTVGVILTDAKGRVVDYRCFIEIIEINRNGCRIGKSGTSLIYPSISSNLRSIAWKASEALHY